MDSGRKLPENPARWTEWAEEEDVRGKPIHEEKLSSASKITLRQYLLLRVLWTGPFKKLDYQWLDLERWMKQAEEMLESHHSWKVYLDSFGGKPGEGNFFLVTTSQADAANVKSEEISQDVMFSPISKHTRQKSRERREQNQTPTKSISSSIGRLALYDKSTAPATPIVDDEDETSSEPEPMSTGYSLGPKEIRHEMYPKLEDEQIVNIATKQLKAKFKDAEYEARTDGYLRGKARKEVRALIEVKAPLRESSQAEIRMQESAQMVAWLKESPHAPKMLPFRRFHVSQDRHEIWLSFAEYDREYIKYIEDGSQNPNRPLSFLTMHEFGPFNTLKKEHMAKLGPILLALTLRADHDRREEQGKPQPL
ncbi:hypothetical protein P170DRAFT_505893 [Aspergillus steynii IBT 23096]|uniref:Uncharacterized protein n=1 Tax=Aspergillus steynii IBT 23096 TaxID=1392250 RepID=A0A2I2GQX3_9EURO|nr:uncharacterized protein P170DRAFT_505893 [Aspergillus steynii IBT 23096]PLB55280.1 hypothetical protein P170DRAFT_505893 [Aspergillus steynii IBT 23096]